MEEQTLNGWADFENALSNLQQEHDDFDWGLSAKAKLLFRGQSDAAWPLSTTLERYTGKIRNFDDYLRTISATASAVESLTKKKWEVPGYPELAAWATDPKRVWLSTGAFLCLYWIFFEFEYVNRTYLWLWKTSIEKAESAYKKGQETEGKS